MKNKDLDSFAEKLDEHYEWPAEYLFKFIVPKQSAPRLLAVFEVTEGVSVRESRGGKYISVSARVLMTSASDVIEVYKAVQDIGGIIAL